MSDFKLYEEFKSLYETNNLTALMSRTMRELMNYNVLLMDKVVAVRATTEAEQYAENEYEHFIVVELYTEHLLKAVLKVGEKGTVKSEIKFGD